MVRTTNCDLAIAGGGLAGGLIALALAARRPDLHVVLVDQGEKIGGHHIWSFFHGDIADADRWLLAPLVEQGWQGYHVAFPQRRRKIGTPYYSILSERLDAAVRAALPEEALITGVGISTLTRTAIVLNDGSRVQARAVIDARGMGDVHRLDVGWQKFVGRIVRTAEPHGLERPVVMDATVAQIDGFRFVYLLPFGPDRLLIEDTYYSDTAQFDRDVIGQRIDDYATGRGWTIAAVEREEAGALPVVMGGDFEAYWESGGKGIGKVGVRAGLFHPTTGYSLPDAVRTAVYIAGLEQPASRTLHDLLYEYARDAWAGRGYYRLLDRMLFRAAEPEARYRVMQRFYGLDRGLIERFYAARSTGLDRLRILAGRPPVPIGRALAVLPEMKVGRIG